MLEESEAYSEDAPCWPWSIFPDIRLSSSVKEESVKGADEDREEDPVQPHLFGITI